MKRVPYIYKHDYFVVIQWAICVSPLRRFETEVALATIASYLKIRELTLPTLHEMVPFCQTSVTRFQQRCMRVNDNFKRYLGEESLQLKFNEYTFEEMFTQWKKISKFFEMSSVHDSLQEVLRNFAAKIPIRDNELVYNRMFAWSKCIVLEVEKFIHENQMWFYPRFAFNEKNYTPVVRIFADKPNKLIMAHELLVVMKQEHMDVSSFEKEVLEMPKLATFTFQEVAARVSPEDFKNIEFVIIPITAAKYSATPIPTITPGGLCILASDFIFNLLVNMLTAKKIFQKIDPSQFDLIREFFNFIDEYFGSAKGVMFVDLKDVEVINKKWEAFYKTLTISCEEPKKVRNTRKTEFTKEDLTNELKYLKLDLIFSEICEQSQDYFDHMTRAKNLKTLPNDVFSGAIVHLQIDCICRRISKIPAFIHNQLACSRIFGYRCPVCVDANTPKADDVKAPTPEELVEVREISPVAENLEPTSESKRVKSKKQKKQKPSENPIAKPEEKQSNACPKCFRASEYNIKLRDDLRLEKIETKHLRKSLKLSQQESEEKSQKIAGKNEEIEHLKAQVETTKRELLDQKSELNHEKDETIRLQMEQILDHQNALVKKSLQVIERDEEIQLLKAQIQAQQNAIAQQKISIRNLELENRKLMQKKPTLVAETIPQRFTEDTEKVQDILFEMLKAQAVLEVENPMNKINKMTSKLIQVSKNRENKIISKREFIYFERQIRGYTKEVENRIKIIRSNEQISSDQIPELRNFPTFSDEFLKAYKDTFKENAPLICAQLLKTPESQKSDDLEDKECLVCLEDMMEEHETLKCSNCKRQYHTGCAQKWFKVKRICPTCNSGLLDDTEFPVLV
ncbi:RING-type domain-containing protein [Caenorhabditis elegans]|uniref:RING-type domain-containing protein n=1 Tax=Caenorhabditis elegans TaxID=6239 RepID=Q9TXW5_CAEEL|nr:RING-type domain-containing protein [Caenorhabditis elegans]CCD67822.2 RING-type domain-containing protein [Caenorhabditis elegans]|eukprot:NP_503853.2 Uncharacterized protein CELE_Y73C8C.8 [Caenorhabditis elegans]